MLVSRSGCHDVPMASKWIPPALIRQRLADAERRREVLQAELAEVDARLADAEVRLAAASEQTEHLVAELNKARSSYTAARKARWRVCQERDRLSRILARVQEEIQDAAADAAPER